MANGVKIEGDIKDLSPNQIDFIISSFEKQGYCNTKVTVEPVGQAGDNYAANVKRITAEKNGETLKMIVKVAPKMPMFREMGQIRQLFSNENTMYTKMLPKVTKLEEEAGIPPSERLRYAKCYGNLMDETDEMVLLEDLQLSNFVMLDRFTSLTDDEVKIFLKSFAKLHAGSYALKFQRPSDYNDIKESLFNIWEKMYLTEEMAMFFTILENDTIEVCNDDKYTKAFKGRVSSLTQNAKKIWDDDAESKFSVIQQGDSWTNNVMFQKQGGIYTECCMIDYQISKASSPVADLQYMLFNCTDYDMRKKYFASWIDYYYSELDKRLSEFNLKVNDVYPRKQLDEDMTTHATLTLGLGMMLATMLVREKDEAQVIKDSMESDGSEMDAMMEAARLIHMKKETLDLFKKRVKGLVDSLVELGYIQL